MPAKLQLEVLLSTKYCSAIFSVLPWPSKTFLAFLAFLAFIKIAFLALKKRRTHTKHLLFSIICVIYDPDLVAG